MSYLTEKLRSINQIYSCKHSQAGSTDEDPTQLPTTPEGYKNGFPHHSLFAFEVRVRMQTIAMVTPRGEIVARYIPNNKLWLIIDRKVQPTEILAEDA
jgi:hypothetical protein